MGLISGYVSPVAVALSHRRIVDAKGRTIRKLIGSGGEYKKINLRKGKLNEQNSCPPINPKKYTCYGLKTIHTRNLITKKNFCGLKIPHPSPPPPLPHNFSDGPSLTPLNYRFM